MTFWLKTSSNSKGKHTTHSNVSKLLFINFLRNYKSEGLFTFKEGYPFLGTRMLTPPIQTTFLIARYLKQMTNHELLCVHGEETGLSGGTSYVRRDEKPHTVADNTHLGTWKHLSPSWWLQSKWTTWKDRSIWLTHGHVWQWKLLTLMSWKREI